MSLEENMAAMSDLMQKIDKHAFALNVMAVGTLFDGRASFSYPDDDVEVTLIYRMRTERFIYAAEHAQRP